MIGGWVDNVGPLFDFWISHQGSTPSPALPGVSQGRPSDPRLGPWPVLLVAQAKIIPLFGSTRCGCTSGWVPSGVRGRYVRRFVCCCETTVGDCPDTAVRVSLCFITFRIKPVLQLWPSTALSGNSQTLVRSMEIVKETWFSPCTLSQRRNRDFMKCLEADVEDCALGHPKQGHLFVACLLINSWRNQASNKSSVMCKICVIYNISFAVKLPRVPPTVSLENYSVWMLLAFEIHNRCLNAVVAWLNKQPLFWVRRQVRSHVVSPPPKLPLIPGNSPYLLTTKAVDKESLQWKIQHGIM